MSYSKIFFHAGPACSCTGIGDLFRELDAAGIPFGHKSADEYGTVWEAAQYANATTIWRLTTAGQNDGRQYDVPDYSLPPADAALKHWLITKAKLPPELNRNTWIEPINEVDKNRADWLGYFALAIASIANSEGYKVSLFAFSSGEPEADAWETPGMLAYLRYCADNPDKAAVSLHEYSYTTADLFEGFPYLVGRFQFLHDVCDDNGIARPTIFISEFGWEYQNVPGVEQAMAEIAQAAELYAAYPNINQVDIWYLGGGANWPNIGQQTQKLIEPVKQYTLTAEFPDPPAPPDGGNMEKEIEVTITTELPGQPVQIRGWDKATGRKVKYLQYRWMHHDGNGITYTGWTTLPIPTAIADLRGIEIMPVHDYTVTNTVTVDCEEEPTDPNPPDPPGAIEIADIVDDLPKHATLTYSIRPLEAITTLTIHHTVSPPDRSIESIAAYHVDSNGWPGIGYHYVIKDDGRIFQTNYLETKSYHAGSSAAPGDENAVSVGISLQGDFTNAAPPQAQQDAARALVGYLSGLLPSVTAVLGHRQMPGASTQCPGNTYQSWLPYVAGGVGEPVLKFQPGDRVEVHTEELNVRDAPYGNLLGSQQPGAKGTIIEGGIANGGFIWWNVNYDSGVDGWCAENWLKKAALEQPSGKTINFSPYLMPPSDIGPFLVFEKAAGGTIDHQMQVRNGIAYVVKRAAVGTEYEELRISNGYIERRYDTSPADGLPYKLDDGYGWSKWMPVTMTEGEYYKRAPRVTKYDKNCNFIADQGVSESYIYFAKYHDSYTLPGGVVKTAVCELHWLWAPGGTVLEKYFVSPGLWYIMWGNGDALHYLNEEPQGREPLPLSPIPCLV